MSVLLRAVFSKLYPILVTIFLAPIKRKSVKTLVSLLFVPLIFLLGLKEAAIYTFLFCQNIADLTVFKITTAINTINPLSYFFYPDTVNI